MSAASHFTPKLLNRVIDSLHVRISQNRMPSPWFLGQREELLRKFELWSTGDDPIMVELPGLAHFEARPEGRHYEMKFIHSQVCDIRVWRPENWLGAFSTGHLYVQFYSVFLQFHGLAGARKVLQTIQDTFYGAEVAVEAARPGQHDYWRIGRVDMAVDTHEERGMLDEDLDHYVTRARSNNAFSTLTDATVKELINGVSHDKKPVPPHQDNKGYDNLNPAFSPPPDGPAATAAHELLRSFADVMEDARRQDKGGAFVSQRVRRHKKLQTVYFGRFNSDLWAIRYNKLASLAVQQKEYMLDVWLAGGWSPDMGGAVWRTEFRMTGKMLKNLVPAVCHIAGRSQLGVQIDGLHTFDQFEQHQAHIWTYLTQEWLRHCTPNWGDEQNPDRWPPSAWWRVVQAAWTTEDDVTLKRRHWAPMDPTDSDSSQRLRASVEGYIVSYSARSSRNDQGEPIIDFVDPETGEVIQRGGAAALLEELNFWARTPDYRDAVSKRRREFGMNDETDRMLSALLLDDASMSGMVRAERMLEGIGS